jgi:hypothetical protein
VIADRYLRAAGLVPANALDSHSASPAAASRILLELLRRGLRGLLLRERGPCR